MKLIYLLYKHMRHDLEAWKLFVQVVAILNFCDSSKDQCFFLNPENSIHNRGFLFFACKIYSNSHHLYYFVKSHSYHQIHYNCWYITTMHLYVPSTACFCNKRLMHIQYKQLLISLSQSHTYSNVCLLLQTLMLHTMWAWLYRYT